MLSTYLRDHHAGATSGVELAKRAARAVRDDPDGAEIARVAAEIARDRRILEQVMAALGVAPNRAKDLLARALEAASRMKLNNRLVQPSPLSRVVELEALVIGITGQIALWQALDTVPGLAVDGVDFQALARQAADLRSRVNDFRLRVAASALRAD